MSDDLPRPVTTPRHPSPSLDDTGEVSLDEMKKETKLSRKQRGRRPWYYGLGAVLTAGGLGTGGLSYARGESQETKNMRVELRLDAGEKATAALDAGVAALGTRLGKVERKVDSMRAEQRVYNQLVLEKLGVPRSKQPKPSEDEE